MKIQNKRLVSYISPVHEMTKRDLNSTCPLVNSIKKSEKKFSYPWIEVGLFAIFTGLILKIFSGSTSNLKPSNRILSSDLVVYKSKDPVYQILFRNINNLYLKFFCNEKFIFNYNFAERIRSNMLYLFRLKGTDENRIESSLTSKLPLSLSEDFNRFSSEFLLTGTGTGTGLLYAKHFMYSLPSATFQKHFSPQTGLPVCRKDGVGWNISSASINVERMMSESSSSTIENSWLSQMRETAFVGIVIGFAWLYFRSQRAVHTFRDQFKETKAQWNQKFHKYMQDNPPFAYPGMDSSIILRLNKKDLDQVLKNEQMNLHVAQLHSSEISEDQISQGAEQELTKSILEEQKQWDQIVEETQAQVKGIKDTLDKNYALRKQIDIRKNSIDSQGVLLKDQESRNRRSSIDLQKQSPNWNWKKEMSRMAQENKKITDSLTKEKEKSQKLRNANRDLQSQLNKDLDQKLLLASKNHELHQNHKNEESLRLQKTSELSNNLDQLLRMQKMVKTTKTNKKLCVKK